MSAPVSYVSERAKLAGHSVEIGRVQSLLCAISAMASEHDHADITNVAFVAEQRLQDLLDELGVVQDQELAAAEARS